VQQKTGRPVLFEITEPAREALAAWLVRRGRRSDDWLFPSRSRPGEPLSTRQYARLVGEWVAMIDLEPTAYGTHSLRRTKVALVYKRAGNLAAGVGQVTSSGIVASRLCRRAPVAIQTPMGSKGRNLHLGSCRRVDIQPPP
jgi:hypothetical protein